MAARIDTALARHVQAGPPAGRLRTLDDVDVTGKRVLVRVDLNVPLEGGTVRDATRIDRAEPTLREILARGGTVILLSHFGRPKGREPEASLRPVGAAVAAALGQAVAFCDDCIGGEVKRALAGLGSGRVLLLENTRFYPGEERNDPQFARALAASGDVFVNDAFSAAHRAHASTEGLARLLPACAGRAMQVEIEALESVLEKPERPVVAVVGGAKVSTKLPILKHMLGKVDHLVIGGAMANTFLLAQGIAVGKSLAEPALVSQASERMARARAKGCHIVLPVDAVCAPKLEAGVATVTADIGAVPADQMMLDAGPATIERLSGLLASARTLLWNGPLGAFETAPFGRATFALAQEAGRLTADGRLKSVAGGGDTVAALHAAGAADRFTYVSTAGGAFLEWLEGRVLPGVAVLMHETTSQGR